MDLIVCQTELAPDLSPEVLLAVKGDHEIDAVKGHPVALTLPALPAGLWGNVEPTGGRAGASERRDAESACSDRRTDLRGSALGRDRRDSEVG